MKKELTYQRDTERSGTCDKCQCEAECFTEDMWLCPECTEILYQAEIWHFLENLGATDGEFEDANIDIIVHEKELCGFEIIITIDTVVFDCIKLPIEQLIKGWWKK